MNLDAGLQAFSEESRELLQSMEDTLLQLEAKPDDDDLINGLFRAVHTVKGSAGLFGFDRVVEFAHLAESVMGRVRDHQVAVANDLPSLLLESRDHLGLLIEQALDGKPDPDEDSIRTGKALSARLQRHLSDRPAGEAQSRSIPAPTAPVLPARREAGVENRCWHISLRFGTEVLRNGMDPLSFIRYLNTAGEIVNLTTLEAMPDPAEMDAESCYLGFEIDLNSAADKEAIASVFEFVQDDCLIHILPPNSPIASYGELIEALPEENARIGEILRAGGALTESEFGTILAGWEKRLGGAGGEAESMPEPSGDAGIRPGVVEPSIVNAGADKYKKVKEHKEEENQVVRVSAAKLEDLVNLVGELVISGANTNLLARRSGGRRLADATETLAGLVENIRDTALSLRMVEIGTTFNRFRRVVREVSRELGKEIDLVISGGDTGLDKTVADKIGDPLMHLVRNALDHGIETPAERESAGKPLTETLHLNAYHDSGSIVIEICDDGRGLVREKILAKALEKRLIKENQSLTDSEIQRLIFEPGFSTAEQATNLSGRGVGMDVVLRNIAALRGRIDVESTPGEGAKISIRLPLTLAIIDGFLVQVGKSSYVIPLDLVDECVEFSEVASESYQDSQHINLRGEILPYIRLGEVFNCHTPGARDSQPQKVRENVVVTRYAGQKAGLVVDELLGEHQTVIKPLGTIFKNVKGLSGATILGSGEVAMIVDVPGLVSRVSESGCPQRTNPVNLEEVRH
ncbi:MAG: chemotaxis protein CheA [Methylococcaceae bacterium]|nr:chemotaxis protein CheA [Methylococcaceae bacterium]